MNLGIDKLEKYQKDNMADQEDEVFEIQAQNEDID